MKELWIIRHAKAKGSSDSGRDYDRELSDKGIKAAVQLASRIASSERSPTWIVSSAAARTMETASIVQQSCGLLQDVLIPSYELYLAPSGPYSDAIRSLPPDIRRAAIVGHNPTLTGLVNDLTGKPLLDNLPTMGCVHLTSSQAWSDWRPGTAVAVEAFSPKHDNLLS